MPVRVPTVSIALAKHRIEESLSHTRSPDTYYVTDLVVCPLKREFELHLQNATVHKSINGRLMLGVVIHRGILSLLKEVYGDRVKTEVEDPDGLKKSKTLMVDGRRVTVEGRIDAILDGNVGIEVKSSLSTGQLPQPWHEIQAALYNWLYGLDYTILLYVTPSGLYEYAVDRRYSDTEVIEMIEMGRAPRYEWECRYCPFQSLCPVGRGVRGGEGEGG